MSKGNTRVPPIDAAPEEDMFNVSGLNVNEVEGEGAYRGEGDWQDHNEGSQEGEEEEETQEEHDLKQKILTASLSHVKQHGWTSKAIMAGAEDVGLSSAAHGMFPRGGADLVFFFQKSCNQKLADHLKQELAARAEDSPKPKTTDFFKSAIETRLRMIAPYIETWPQAVAIQAMPQNIPEAFKNLMHLMDDMWYYSGDRSHDINWYTKRMSLAGVYKTTEIHMLQDKSEDFVDSWTFLSNRLNDISNLGKCVKEGTQVKDVVADGLKGAVLMGQNLLGVGSKFRK